MAGKARYPGHLKRELGRAEAQGRRMGAQVCSCPSRDNNTALGPTLDLLSCLTRMVGKASVLN